MHRISNKAAGSVVTHVVNAGLLIGGAKVFLPVVRKH